MPAELRSTSQGQTLILTLSNPERRNAIDPVMYAAGVEALGVAESSPDIRSVVITGSDGMFCSGGNLQRLLANRQQPPEVQAAWNEATTLFQTWTPAQIGAQKGNQQPRKRFLELAGLLDMYNNGLIGPGHCSE